MLSSPWRRLNAFAAVALAVFVAGAPARAVQPLTPPQPDTLTYQKLAPAQKAYIDDLERRTFDWFWQSADPYTGLVPDSWPNHTFSSIAAVGFGLTAYGIGVERGYVSREQAVQRTLVTLRFLAAAPQSDSEDDASGYHGFFYHFLDMRTGLREGRWVELSSVDTTLLMGGVLFAGSYYAATHRWSTLNEPWVVTDGGYLHGALAPGHRNKYEAPLAAHNLMRASGAGIQAYRAHGRHEIGVVFNIEPKYPHSDNTEDLAATARAHAYMNQQFADPALLGSYPPELKEIFGEAWPDFPVDDFKLTQQRVDFVGINYYTRAVVKHDPNQYPLKAVPVRQPNRTYTETGWEVFEQGLTDTLTWFKSRYGDIPLYVTENGSAFYDPPVVETEVLHDPLRTNYLRRHLKALHRAIEAGVNLKGYYAWSLLDNLEWSLGFSKRFGLYHVDFATQRRTPKATATLYARVIESHGEALGEA